MVGTSEEDILFIQYSNGRNITHSNYSFLFSFIIIRYPRGIDSIGENTRPANKVLCQHAITQLCPNYSGTRGFEYERFFEQGLLFFWTPLTTVEGYVLNMIYLCNAPITNKINLKK